ncbi:centrosomal protein of 290 kDa-like isoform X1 [Sarcophilus harrisii]|uniref:centrosomal protein of 290 kDa-like isoform X1 n=2 Tax=Sarcophilus harrisii TaxID=9305 RepID=UPI001301E620|nr:centrosomal protein of 290 kDa-like isoform X1 [Sarcophilus harrisii]
MKAQKMKLASEKVEKAREEQAKFGNQLKTKVMKLENELEVAQQFAGGQDTCFLGDKINQLEIQLEQKHRELEDMEKEMEKEKKVNEQLALLNEEAENENRKLRRENLTEANEKTEIQNQEMKKNLEESVQEMEKMTDKYNRMKIIVQQNDVLIDQLKKERLQVQELTELLKEKDEDDDPIMATVNAKVEEWKRIFASKDDEIIKYQQIVCNLREKIRNAQLDADKNNVITLQEGIQERDGQIKLLIEQVEQYTKEMETNTQFIEEMRRHKGDPYTTVKEVKMPLDWKTLWTVNPDDLPHQEELADDLLVSLSKVEVKDLKDENQENVIHLFQITRSLMKMKTQEVEIASEEVEKAGEQAKFENQLKTKVMKLENEFETAQHSADDQDTQFFRDEILQLEKQLEQKGRELENMEKEMEKEKKVNEQLVLLNEETENANSKLREKNEQLCQDITDYQKQIDSQKETVISRREDSDYRSQLSKKNFELLQYLDEIQNLTEANKKIEIQNQEMKKDLEESVQEMEKMTDKYNRMKINVQQSDTLKDQLKKERLQVQELTELLKAKNEEDDLIMVAVNAKVEEWKSILASKDDKIIEYQQILYNLREKFLNTQLDGDNNNIIALQQGIQERDGQIKILIEQVKQYTREMETNTLIIEDLRKHKRASQSSL